MTSRMKQLFQQKGMHAVQERFKELGVSKADQPTKDQLMAPGPLAGRPHKGRGRHARIRRQESAALRV